MSSSTDHPKGAPRARRLRWARRGASLLTAACLLAPAAPRVGIDVTTPGKSQAWDRAPSRQDAPPSQGAEGDSHPLVRGDAGGAGQAQDMDGSHLIYDDAIEGLARSLVLSIIPIVGVAPSAGVTDLTTSTRSGEWNGALFSPSTPSSRGAGGGAFGSFLQDDAGGPGLSYGTDAGPGRSLLRSEMPMAGLGGPGRSPSGAGAGRSGSAGGDVAWIPTGRFNVPLTGDPGITGIFTGASLTGGSAPSPGAGDDGSIPHVRNDAGLPGAGGGALDGPDLLQDPLSPGGAPAAFLGADSPGNDGFGGFAGGGFAGPAGDVAPEPSSALLLGTGGLGLLGGFMLLRVRRRAGAAWGRAAA